jgi:hypothetical protein
MTDGVMPVNYGPTIGESVVDETGARITVITRIDGSRFRVTVPAGALENRIYDPWPRDKYRIRIEEITE